MRKFEVVGFWDSCFFIASSKCSGLIVQYEDGTRENISYYKLNKLRKEQDHGKKD